MAIIKRTGPGLRWVCLLVALLPRNCRYETDRKVFELPKITLLLALLLGVLRSVPSHKIINLLREELLLLWLLLLLLSFIITVVFIINIFINYTQPRTCLELAFDYFVC